MFFAPVTKPEDKDKITREGDGVNPEKVLPDSDKSEMEEDNLDETKETGAMNPNEVIDPN